MHQQTQTTDTGWCITKYACLLPAFSGYSFQPGTESGLSLSGPGCLALHWGGLPVQRRSPTQALTGPSVE